MFKVNQRRCGGQFVQTVFRTNKAKKAFRIAKSKNNKRDIVQKHEFFFVVEVS